MGCAEYRVGLGSVPRWVERSTTAFSVSGCQFTRRFPWRRSTRRAQTIDYFHTRTTSAWHVVLGALGQLQAKTRCARTLSSGNLSLGILSRRILSNRVRLLRMPSSGPMRGQSDEHQGGTSARAVESSCFLRAEVLAVPEITREQFPDRLNWLARIIPCRATVSFTQNRAQL
jgi:hypothetical protein